MYNNLTAISCSGRRSVQEKGADAFNGCNLLSAATEREVIFNRRCYALWQHLFTMWHKKYVTHLKLSSLMHISCNLQCHNAPLRYVWEMSTVQEVR